MELLTLLNVYRYECMSYISINVKNSLFPLKIEIKKTGI